VGRSRLFTRGKLARKLRKLNNSVLSLTEPCVYFDIGCPSSTANAIIESPRRFLPSLWGGVITFHKPKVKAAANSHLRLARIQTLGSLSKVQAIAIATHYMTYFFSDNGKNS
jgi:hypothetical protein